MTATERYGFGDRVSHGKRPEWGVGSVIKAEDTVHDGKPTQRLSVRFPSEGLKTFNLSHAPLVRVTENDAPIEASADEESPVEIWDRIAEEGWLAPVAQRKIEEIMLRLPGSVSDPFLSVARRLEAMASLYRFDRSGGRLVEWAVAQTGLDDPLSRFNRHELERYFDRWAHERDGQFRRLASEAAPADVKAALRDAPPAASRVLSRVGARTS